VQFPAADGFSHLLPIDCDVTEDNYSVSLTYRKINKILYPVNVGRNVAREEAKTHFLLASDIELYPSPGFIPDFLKMIRRQLMSSTKSSTLPKVYPLNLFEVQKNATVPSNKTQLVQMLKSNHAIPFHKEVHCLKNIL
jgi:beta-1,4-glucuronyltransferase 1